MEVTRRKLNFKKKSNATPTETNFEHENTHYQNDNLFLNQASKKIGRNNKMR